MIERDARDWRVTNAALLLFAQRPALRWHPRAGLRVFRVAGTEIEYGRRRNVTQIGRADPPLASAIHEITELARHQVGRSERLARPPLRGRHRVPRFRLAGIAGQRCRPPRLRGAGPGDRDLVLRGPPGGIQSLENSSRPSPWTRCGKAGGFMRPAIQGWFVFSPTPRSCGMKARGSSGSFVKWRTAFLREPEMTSESGLFTITLFNEPDWQVYGPGWRHFVGRLRVTDDQRRMLLLRPHGFTQGRL